MATEKVNLYAPELKEKREFDIEQAQKMLNRKNSGWELKDTDFKFKNGIIKRNHSGEANKTDTQ